MIIFGIDPGLNKTGVGILNLNKKDIGYLSHQIIKTNPKENLCDRLGVIVNEISLLIDKYKPQYAAIEDIFYSVNIRSAMLLGHTRGAIISAFLMKQVNVEEYTALQIKKSVVGYGKADKEQVKKLVEIHLNQKFDGVLHDITDALACGICLGLNLTGAQFDILSKR